MHRPSAKMADSKVNRCISMINHLSSIDGPISSSNLTYHH
jgi:hypothetical protein